ncbi:MAG: phosphotransferase family protein [Denitromonas halophila]|nr:MAG: phosphotransferase family protein [Denitromonas halophila]
MALADKRYLSDPDIDRIRSAYRVERTIDEALTWKLRRRRGPDYRLPPMAELQARLQAFLLRQIAGPFDILDLQRLSGGGSKEMFRFGLRRNDEQSRPIEETLILRMTPGESIVETHRLREFQIIAAMAGVVPVPPVLWVDVDGTVLGNPGMLCGLVEGVAKPKVAQHEGGSISGIGAGFPPALREPLFEQFVDHLASIHRFDWRSAALTAFDTPAAGTTEAARLGLEHWSRVWEEDSLEEHPVITLARQWLKRNLPVADEIRVVHNDYRNGNFLFNEDTREITAILDWELARLGDIHEDLAWVLFPGFASPDEHGTPLVCGLGTREAFLERYSRASGITVDTEKLHFYTVLNLYKLAILGSATNARAAADRQSHLDVMMNFSTGLGYGALACLYQILKTGGAAK